MPSSKKIGEIGEDIAVEHLISKDYQILARNWRFKKAEIDIIAKQEDVLIFVEVKTRNHVGILPPAAAVNKKKQVLLFTAANAYMDEINHDWEVRFDIISIIFDDQYKPNLIHHEDAFFF